VWPNATSAILPKLLAAFSIVADHFGSFTS